MFFQYYRYQEKYQSRNLLKEERLTIVYPTDDHGMITARHDFYVIGEFHNIKIAENAELKVEVKSLKTGKILRTVSTEKKENKEGIFAEFDEIVTEDDRETIKSSGMPDLVYDPEKPDSIFDTWNKAYYTDRFFAALVYGGTYRRDQINQRDQFGRSLEELEEGEYELSVSLDNGNEIICSKKTILLASGRKEIILSRFSPESHVNQVARFAEREGFEEFSDPYAGIWDTQFFACGWPVKAYIEIPSRWYWGDVQEYETGRVHFFNYHISETCISYQMELATMLSKDPLCMNHPERLTTYFYKQGEPNEEKMDQTYEQLEKMRPNQYLYLTKTDCRVDGEQWSILIDSVSSILPSKTMLISDCSYIIENRVESLEYHFRWNDSSEDFQVEEEKTGIWKEKEDHTKEFLILESHHEFQLIQREPDKKLIIHIFAKNSAGMVVDEVSVCFPKRQM